jgi:hypothetical protein
MRVGLKLLGLSSVIGRRRVELLKARIRERVRLLEQARANRAGNFRGIGALDGQRREG